jgi:phage terminase large subunit GpA-like protein
VPDAAEIIAAARRDGWRPPANMPVSAWAERNIVLAGKEASEPGPYRTARTPYAREPMDHMSVGSSVQEIVLLWGSQTSKTTIANCCVGYWIDVEPAPVLVVQPTLDLAKRYSRQRLAPMIEASPALRAKFADNRSRDEANTLLVKEFPGGVLVNAGANSAAGLRMMPARYLFKDEIDGYPQDVDGEGEPCDLADKRQTTFGARARRITTSTPKDELTSRIGPKYEAGSRGRYFVPCPHCDELQPLKWANLRWRDNDPSTAHYVCAHCGAEIEEHHKAKMLPELGRGGRARWVHEDPSAAVKSYHLSSLYSPLGWASWAMLVEEFLDAKRANDQGDNSKLKAFINTRLAEIWKDQGEQASSNEIAERAKVSGHEIGIVPAGGLLLTLSADVQGNRIEAAVKAWGRGEESWLVDYVVLWGEPADLLSGKDPRLDELERRVFTNAHGKEMRISVTAIDSGGHHTHDVYMHVRTRRVSRYVIAVKGSSEGWKPILAARPTDVEIDWRGERIARGAQVWIVGTDTAKDLIYNRLRRVKEPGPGYLHFPRPGNAAAGEHALPEGYYDGLASEKLVTTFHKGRPRRTWHLPKGRRNEPLDCEVYALAAAHFAGITRMREPEWQRLERAFGPDLFASPSPTPTREAQAAPAPPAGADPDSAPAPTEEEASPDQVSADAPEPAEDSPPAAPATESARRPPFRRRNPFVNGWKKGA